MSIQEKIKVGLGFDVHKFSQDRKLVLGGIEIPYKYGLAGHSDADVLTHSVIDALLGATGNGDIGEHFPDNDKQYKNISSMNLLTIVYDKLIKNLYKVNNIDIIVICEEPRIRDYKKLMKKNIAKILKLSENDINIKGTTTEQLGFTGRKEGIACKCVCTVVKI